MHARTAATSTYLALERHYPSYPSCTVAVVAIHFLRVVHSRFCHIFLLCQKLFHSRPPLLFVGTRFTLQRFSLKEIRAHKAPTRIIIFAFGKLRFIMMQQRPPAYPPGGIKITLFSLSIQEKYHLSSFVNCRCKLRSPLLCSSSSIVQIGSTWVWWYGSTASNAFPTRLVHGSTEPPVKVPLTNSHSTAGAVFVRVCRAATCNVRSVTWNNTSRACETQRGRGTHTCTCRTEDQNSRICCYLKLPTYCARPHNFMPYAQVLYPQVFISTNLPPNVPWLQWHLHFRVNLSHYIPLSRDHSYPF